MRWSQSREPHPFMSDPETGVRAVVDNDPREAAVVLTSSASPGMSLRVPVADLVWLLIMSGIDWRAGLDGPIVNQRR